MISTYANVNIPFSWLQSYVETILVVDTCVGSDNLNSVGSKSMARLYSWLY